MPSTLTFPGTGSYFQILIITLHGRNTDGRVTLLVALFVHRCVPKFCLWCCSSNVAWVLITGTGQPYLLSALPQRGSASLDCRCGQVDWWKQRKDDICDIQRGPGKLECLAVYQCIKTKSQSYSMYSKTLMEEELHTLVNYQVLVCPGHWKSLKVWGKESCLGRIFSQNMLFDMYLLPQWLVHRTCVCALQVGWAVSLSRLKANLSMHEHSQDQSSVRCCHL